MKNKLYKAGLTLLVPVSLTLAYFAMRLNTGALELVRWDSHILSSHTALFFGILMCVGAMGGYLASKQKTKRRKLIANALTLVVVLLLVQVLGRFTPFLGFVGK